MINYLNVITWVNKSLWLVNKTNHFVLHAFFGGHCIWGMFTSPNKFLNHLEAIIFLMNFVVQPKWYSSIGRFGQNGYKPNMKYKKIILQYFWSLIGTKYTNSTICTICFPLLTIETP